MRVWRAGPGEAARVAELLIGFRDHMGRSEPADASFHATVRRLIATPDTEYLLAAPADGGPAAGVVQLRFRWTVWWDAVEPDNPPALKLYESLGFAPGRQLYLRRGV